MAYRPPASHRQPAVRRISHAEARLACEPEREIETNHLLDAVIAAPVVVHIPLFSLPWRTAPAPPARVPFAVLPFLRPRALSLPTSVPPPWRLVLLPTKVALPVRLPVAVPISPIVSGRAMYRARAVVVVVSPVVPSPHIPPIALVLLPAVPLSFPISVVPVPYRLLPPPAPHAAPVLVLCGLP